MSLFTLRQAVVETVSTAIPSLQGCAVHGGRFDIAELKRLAARTPCVLVSTLGLDNLNSGHGEIVADVRFVIFALAGDKPQLPRDQAALAIMDALALLVPGNRWGLAEAETTPSRIRAENLFSGQVDKAGVALWAMSFSQRMVIGQVMDAATLATLDIFATFAPSYEIGDGSPVADDLVAMPQED